MTVLLKKILFLSNRIEEIPFFNLCSFRLEADGLCLQTILISNKSKNLNEEVKQRLKDTLDDKEKKEEGILYITDNRFIGSCLQQQELPVLLFQNPHQIIQDSEQIRENLQSQEEYTEESPDKEFSVDAVHFPYVLEGLEDVDAEYFERIYRRLKKIPWDILETERLYVRETVIEDLPDFYRIYREPSITRFTENLFENPADEEAYLKAYIETAYRFYETGIYTVILKETGEIIGRAGLDRREEYEELELGFLIAKEHQGKGYATEVCRALLDYAKEYFPDDRVHAFVEPENLISRHLLEKWGRSFCHVECPPVTRSVPLLQKEYLEYFLE